MTERAERPSPMRTCVGCRVRSAKSDLLRIVLVGDALVPDPRGRLPGRGAHLHPEPGCLDLAERRRAFGRALRLTGPYDVTAVREWVNKGPAPAGTAPASTAQHDVRTVPEEGGRQR